MVHRTPTNPARPTPSLSDDPLAQFPPESRSTGRSASLPLHDQLAQFAPEPRSCRHERVSPTTGRVIAWAIGIGLILTAMAASIAL